MRAALVIQDIDGLSDMSAFSRVVAGIICNLRIVICRDQYVLCGIILAAAATPAADLPAACAARRHPSSAGGRSRRRARLIGGSSASRFQRWMRS